MHICAALRVPTVSLFCPLTACSPKLWGPLGNKSEIIMPDQTYCDTKCPIDPKKCDYSKEGGITAEEVAFEVDKFLNEMR
jgi:heptosyltransferase-2